MAFPRLIFENEILPSASEPDAIADLKLDLLFSEDVSRFLTLRPEKQTLLLRREMFSALLADKNSSPLLTSISQTLTEAESLYRAHTTAPCENTASFAFVFLMCKLAHFCELACQTSGYGRLFERFSTYFAKYSQDSAFISASEEATLIASELKSISAFSLKTDTESAKVYPSSGSKMTAALRECARELDIPIKERTPFSFVLGKSVSEALGKVYPEQFSKAVAFTLKYRTLVSGEIFDYLPELKFILGIVDFTREAEKAGIPYCFPTLCEERRIALKNVYDVTLIKKESLKIVPNDVDFSENEPFFYLTGANGGGKTTYLRAVGGAMLLFLAGAPVFCQSGEASLLSAVYTHFPRDERFEGTGRFLDEKKRVDAILDSQDGNALILLNETFATTGEEKAIEQTGILARHLHASGNFGLYITHQHDVAEKEIPFLGVTVDENDSNRRTYRIEKRRLPPRSFAKDILEKYRLDRASLMGRFGLK